MSGGSYPNNWDKWKVFFAKMADNLLPYLQLYIRRNSQRGGGLGNAKGFHRRYSVPVPGKDAQLGGAATINIVSPAQQSVERAKSIIKQEGRQNEAATTTKAKPQRRTRQTRVKAAGRKTVKAVKNKTNRKKPVTKRRKTTAKPFVQDSLS